MLARMLRWKCSRGISAKLCERAAQTAAAAAAAGGGEMEKVARRRCLRWFCTIDSEVRSATWWTCDSDRTCPGSWLRPSDGSSPAPATHTSSSSSSVHDNEQNTSLVSDRPVGSAKRRLFLAAAFRVNVHETSPGLRLQAPTGSKAETWQRNWT